MHAFISRIMKVVQVCASIGHVSLALENEVGGRKSILSMLTYRSLFCFVFGCNNRTVPK